MSFLKNIDLKSVIKNLFILFGTLLVFYLKHNNIIPNLFSTLLFIVLGTLLIIFNIPGKYDRLFRIIYKDDLNLFKQFLSSNGLKVTNIHKIEYIFGKTPIIIAMEKGAYNIFKYLIENDYDLNYVSERGEPVITFATHSANIQFLELLLKYKNKFDINAINKKFKANALEIAIWRGKEEVVEALINAGMKFSINSYNNTNIGKKSIPFEKIPLRIKAALLKRFVFNKTVKDINMVHEFSEKKNLKSFKQNKIYWKEYLQFA